MKCYISAVCVLGAFVAVSLAAPLEESALAPVHNQVKRQADNSEALNRVISYSNSKLQILRQLCPQIFQVIDNVIQNVTSQVFRVVGGALLRSGGLGGGGGASSSGASVGGRVSVVLPTFPPDEDDDDDDDDEEEVDVRSRIGDTDSSNNSTTTASPNALRVNVPISANDNEVDSDSSRVSSSSTIVPVITTSTTSTTTTTPVTSTTTDDATVTSTTDAGVTTTVVNTPEAFTSPTLGNSNTKRHVRIPRAAEEDQEVAASGGNGPNPADDLANVDTDDTDRNKRYLPFGVDASVTGGSGNFLFDLIRNTADRAARTVGTVYRMVAGTENLGFGITATSTSSKTVAAAPASQLVAGSGATEESDEHNAGIGGVAEVDVAPKDAHGEGIPGPITRLLVIANRGIANLIQDLILRLAQTSERIVNFKARLVTALI